MRMRIVLSLLLCSLVSPVAAGELPTMFSSADEIKDRIDAAMPGLLKRDHDTLQELLEGFWPTQTVEAQMPALTALMASGGPQKEVSWRYLGAKKLGSMYRQFVYVCKFDHRMIEWRFTAVEREGRWALSNLNFGPNLDDLMEEKSAGDKKCEQLCEKIVGMIAQGDRDLIDVFKERWVPLDNASDQKELEAVARKLIGGSLFGGRLLKYELIRARAFEDIAAQYQYAIQWSNLTLVLKFDLHHVGGEWRVAQLNFSTVSDGAVVAALADWDPPTRQTAKPQDKKLK